MHVVSHQDLAALAALTRPWRASEPFYTNVLTTVLEAQVGGHLPVRPGTAWLTVHSDHDELAGMAGRVPPRALHLSPMPTTAVETLAAYLLGESLPGVDGPTEAARAFVAAFSRPGGVEATRLLSQRLYRLDRVTPPRRVPGNARTATAADRDLLAAWSEGMAGDYAGGNAVGRADRAAAEPIDVRLAGENLLWVWEVRRTPVSMAWLSPPAAGVTRVSGVYTPPEHRGRGYASACVAAASAYALTRGPWCMLYTDLANPTTNKIYQDLGYRPVGDSETWVFTASG